MQMQAQSMDSWPDEQLQGGCKVTGRGPQRGGATQSQQLQGQQSMVPGGMLDGLRPIGMMAKVGSSQCKHDQQGRHRNLLDR